MRSARSHASRGGNPEKAIFKDDTGKRKSGAVHTEEEEFQAEGFSCVSPYEDGDMNVFGESAGKSWKCSVAFVLEEVIISDFNESNFNEMVG